MKILLVEDNELVAKALTRSLERVGAEVYTTRRIDRALEWAQDVDFVLTDYHLEGETTSARLIRELHRTKVPCVLLTGLPEAVADDVARMIPVLTKPTLPSVIISTIKENLPKR